MVTKRCHITEDSNLKWLENLHIPEDSDLKWL
jgi:hypothetical protein